MDGKRSKLSQKGQKHAYRLRVSCSECSKVIDSDYKDQHAKSQHLGKNVKFTTVISPSQTQLNFTRKNNNEPVGVAKRPKLDPAPDDSVKSVVNSSESNTSEQSKLVDTSKCEDNTDNTTISQFDTNSVSSDAFQTEEISLSLVPLVPPISGTNSESSETRKNNTNSDSLDISSTTFDYNDLVDSQPKNMGEFPSSPGDSSLSPEIIRIIESPKINFDQKEKESHDPNGNVPALNSDLDGPRQPVLDKYNPTSFGKESFQRDFQAGWYKQYPWLNYSIDNHEASCFACERFLNDDSFHFTNWKKTERLKKHHTSANHEEAMAKWISYRSNMRQQTSVMKQLHTAHKDFVETNRKYMKVIMESLFYTAQQNIAQRGHEENRDDIGSFSDVNRGNFLELLRLRCIDIPWLEKKLKTQLEKHAQWTAPAIQNEILQILADLTLERIQQDCIGSGPFGVIVDETSDISRHEQVSICLSFIADGVKKEAFVGFYETKTTDGKTLYDLITKAISDLNLDLINIVGECFDGAANMSGKEKGVAARMKDCSPHAIYVHCYGHLLNLALQDTMTEVEPLRNALGTIQSLYNLLEASSKRHAMFGDIEVERDHLMLTLKSLSVTRWSCRWEAVKAVTEQIERIVKALIKLANDKDAKTYSDSRALLNAICDFEFVLGLCILKVILSNTSALSTYLQGKNVDVINARRNATLTIKALRECRTEESYELIWKRADQISSDIKCWTQNTEFVNFRDARIPRKKPSRRLQNLVGESSTSNTEAMTPMQHYRVNTYYKSFDQVLAELETRFQGNDQDVLCALGAVVLSEKPSESDYELVSNFYGLDKDLIEVDQRLFNQFKQSKANSSRDRVLTASNVIDLLYKNELCEMVPEFTKAATILAVIPATSCSAERSFSGLRRLKTYLRSTMGEKRLGNIALINIERGYANRVIREDMERMIDIFGKRKGRNAYFF